jgi:2-oxoglutarate ferredoxin oxidoreductase subunit beta
MPTMQDFAGYTPTWCPGCGNWSIGRALMMSLANQGLSPADLNVMFDIGCSGNMNDFLNASSMHTLHGRSIANGIGCKIANHEMPLIVVGGDGALYGEGGNHFLHACRGNHDMTILVHDNGVYGLTKGQTSPAAQQGYKSKTTPEGIIERPVYALLLALTQGATFIAQGFTGNLPQLSQLITAAMNHKGFAVVNILQPCVTFNKTNTYGYYFQKAYQVQDHDPSNFQAALEKCGEPMSERFPLGILYQTERPTYTDNIAALKDGPLVKAAAYTGATSLIPWFE